MEQSSYDILLAALEAIAPKDGPAMVRSDMGGHECPHCGGLWYNHKSDFTHDPACEYLAARKAIRLAKKQGPGA